MTKEDAAIIEILRLLSPLAGRHPAKLHRELRELLDEPGVADREALAASPAAEIAAWIIPASSCPRTAP
jgi:hypothetical protein